MNPDIDAPRQDVDPAGRKSETDEALIPEIVQQEGERAVEESTPLDTSNINLDTGAPPEPIVYMKRHLRVFTERGVPEDFARDYGLRSYSEQQTRDALERFTIKGTSLYIPPSGAESWTPRFRLDDPEANDDVRYLTRRGAEVVPFVLRTVSADSDEPVFIVEAPLKALSMLAHGFPSTTGLGGVSAGAVMKGTDKLRPEIMRLVKRGRPFVIVFDSNTATKPQVAAAQAKLAFVLGRAGAAVSLVALPHAGNGKEQGPDDLLVANGPDALRALVAAAVPADPVAWAASVATPQAAADLLRQLPFQAALMLADKPALDLTTASFKKHKITVGAVRSAAEEFRALLAEVASRGAPEAARYQIDSAGRICALQIDFESGEQAEVPLCNFTAKIVEEIILDDGVECERVFVLEGSLSDGSTLPVARVRASEFADLGWIFQSWGARAAPTAGRLAQEQLREAIQVLSKPKCRTVYRHTGWRRVLGERPAFLFHGGAVGSDDASVELEGPLTKYVLPPPARGSSGDAIKVALSLLDVAPFSVTVPLLGAAFFAPLASIIRPDFVVWLVGPTGSLKSELAGLAQSFFGAGFHRTTLPGSWTSTENALETQMFQAKDVLFVIDDYAPQATRRAHFALQERAARVVRSVGNGSARSRLRHDLTQRPDRPPRGMVMVTGEELPVGGSIVARVVRIDIDRSEIRLERLTDLQGQRSALAAAMRNHVESLGPRLSSLQESLPARHQDLRRSFAAVSAHMRQPEALAALELGFEQFLETAVLSLVVSMEEAERLRAEAHAALLEVGSHNSEKQLESDPAATFITTLRALLTQGRAVLTVKGGELDVLAEAGRDPIGWEDATYVYLIAELAHRAVAKFCEGAGGHFGISVDQLKQLLLVRGYLVRPESGQRLEVSLRVGSRTERAIRLHRKVLIEPHAFTEEEKAEEAARLDLYDRIVQ